MDYLPSPFLVPRKPKPMTIERVEAALDKLAEGMVMLGDEGPVLLPLYERIERELAVMKAAEDRMEAVRERVRQSKNRKAERSSKAPAA